MNRLNSVATRMWPDLRDAVEAMPGLGGVALWVKFLDSDDPELIACADGIHVEAGPCYEKYDDAERRFIVVTNVANGLPNLILNAGQFPEVIYEEKPIELKTKLHIILTRAPNFTPCDCDN